MRPLGQVGWNTFAERALGRNYCRFGIFARTLFSRNFAWAKFRERKPSRNGKITLSFIDIGKSCLSCGFFTSLICLLMLFAKIKLSRKFPNLQHTHSQLYLWQIPVNRKALSRLVNVMLVLKNFNLQWRIQDHWSWGCLTVNVLQTLIAQISFYIELCPIEALHVYRTVSHRS